MVKCLDITRHIEKLCPLSIACDWDNVGLLVGRADKEIKKILLTLDVDEYVVSEAISVGADMIVSHHPVMFTPIKRLTENTPQQRFLRSLCKNDVCLYSAHTNMDCAIGGLNDYLAAKLGIENAQVFEETVDGAGFGRYGTLKCKTTVQDMLTRCLKVLNLSDVRYTGDLQREISVVAVNSGSGSNILAECIDRNVDLLITGDLKYTPAREAYENGIAVIDAGHYGTEIIFTELMCKYLSEEFPDTEILVSKANESVLKTYVDKQ